MTKFLIVIMLLLTGLKYISGSIDTNLNNYGFVKLASQGEESGQEKGEEGKSKNENDDKIFSYFMISSILHNPAKFLKISRQQAAYLGFLNSPNTPPPDRV